MIKTRWTKEKDNKQNNNTTALLPAPEGNTLVFLHEGTDLQLWYDLSIHLDTIALRYPNLFAWKFYSYPTYPIEKNAYATFMEDLEKAFLFAPCTSAAFLKRFWAALQNDQHFQLLLAQRWVQPIPFRATHGVAQSILPKPLAAYQQGHERDEACVQICAAIEKKILQYLQFHGKQGGEPTSIALLQETRPLLLASPAKS